MKPYVSVNIPNYLMYPASVLPEEADVYFIAPGDDIDYSSFPNLKVVALTASSRDGLDIGAITRARLKFVSLQNDPLLDTIWSTAEYTFALILSLIRNVTLSHQRVTCQVEDWTRRPYVARLPVRDMKLGVIGVGRIGSMVCQLANAWDMEVLAADKDDPLHPIFNNADIITLHPSMPGGYKLVNREFLDRVRPGTFLINTARGDVVDDDALIEALSKGKLAGAALDCLSGEFMPEFDAAEHPLSLYAVSNNNLIVTPHIGGSTWDAWKITTERILYLAQEALND
jgi:phosphoglycerate dehydrogenase-like enzyme